ncbi:hypothetical protein SPAR86_0504 [Streptococcus pneumoniae GA44511]|nr:hypothetical protein SPAR86_0504 [Streptococcus pneumoniae GA44511]
MGCYKNKRYFSMNTGLSYKKGDLSINNYRKLDLISLVVGKNS